jgi:hypothetical protein
MERSMGRLQVMGGGVHRHVGRWRRWWCLDRRCLAPTQPEEFPRERAENPRPQQGGRR